MVLHLGQEVVVHGEEIIGIFDLEKATVSKRTKEYLNHVTKRGNVVTVSYEMPKSFVVTARDGKETTYISQISSATLLRRASKRM